MLTTVSRIPSGFILQQARLPLRMDACATFGMTLCTRCLHVIFKSLLAIPILIASSLSLSQEENNYVGNAACVGCHQQEAADWLGSHHDLAMQDVSEKTVLGDFDNAHPSPTATSHRPFIVKTANTGFERITKKACWSDTKSLTSLGFTPYNSTCYLSQVVAFKH